jgi:4-hydroxybenzoyl-CoA thioesterase
MNCFSTCIPVRFADCDPAGIVFYPRYFEMMNGVVEDWCAQALGISFRELHLRDGLGLPTVRLESDFIAPSELGELLQAQLTVQKVGGASLHVSIVLLGPQGDERVRASLVLVMMNLSERRAVPLTKAIREHALSFVLEN